MNRLPCFVLPILLAGCGGSVGGVDVAYTVSPTKSFVATGGSVDLKASVLETTYSDLSVSVREGATGGSVLKTTSGNVVSSDGPIADGATYTAPESPGTYHVVVKFLSGTKVVATRTATIVVYVAP